MIINHKRFKGYQFYKIKSGDCKGEYILSTPDYRIYQENNKSVCLQDIIGQNTNNLNDGLTVTTCRGEFIQDCCYPVSFAKLPDSYQNAFKAYLQV